MLLKLLLGLRNGAHRVEVVKLNGEPRPVLGKSHPPEENRRAAVLKQWGVQAESPRPQQPQTIDEALPRRSQTILSHRLAPELRRRIDAGVGQTADARLNNQPGKREQADLDVPDLNRE